MHGENLTISYIHGNVEAVHEDNGSIIIPTVDNQLQSNLLYGTGKGSRFEVLSDQLTWRVGSLSFIKLPHANSIYIHSGSVLFCTNKEPTTLNITSRNSQAVFELLLQMAQKLNIAVVLVTHNEKLAQQSDQEFRMLDGKIFT